MSWNRSQRRALLTLLLLAVGIWGGILIDRYLLSPSPAPQLNEIIHNAKFIVHNADTPATKNFKPKYSGKTNAKKHISNAEVQTSIETESQSLKLEIRNQRPVSSSKFTELQQLDINTIDTTTLKRIPNIASYRARQIIKYREQLGGFYSLSQLAEIKDLPYGLEEWFTLGEGVYRKININTATYSQLATHPYIGSLRAQSIIHYRKLYGTIHALTELSLLDDFSPSHLSRLQPYITY